MTALAILAALGPLTGPAAAIAGARARLAGIAQAAGAAIAFGCSLALLVTLGGRAPLFAWDGFLYVDSLGGFFLMTVAGVTLLAAVGSIGYIAAQEDSGELSRFQVRLYFTFFGLFASLMLAALETGNLGLLFVLVEASTLASAALVGLEGRAHSLEAAWKYVIISSLGVTIALAGTLFLFYSGSALHLGSNLGLTWPYLLAHATALAPQALRLAFLLAVVGYGTKVGLAPMHTWLPDAHAEAPSPASAMLSAALLSTNSFVDRLEACGILTAEQARRLGLVGPLARATGLATDARLATAAAGPGPYADHPVSVVTADSGDVFARFQVMLGEAAESVRLIPQFLDGGTTADRIPLPPGGGAGLGWAESPRGEALAWVALDEDGRITRARLRPGSARNWRGFDDACRSQNVFTDIPIIEASFWLSVAGMAR